MKYLKDVQIKNKTVLLRCDFNVPVNNGVIIDDSKIVKSLDTIKYLLQNDNKVIIFSHFGRVKKEEDKKNNSLYLVYEYLKKYLDLDFISNPLNLEEVLNESSKLCFLVENTRFTDIPEKRESTNDIDLARYWSSFGDVFVVDAFASMHRAHSSTAGISKYLPTYLGFLAEFELESLNILVNDTPHPFVVIMGGAKVDDKIKIINNILEKCDKLFLTGGILNTFLLVAGKNIGNSLVSEDEGVLESVKELLSKYESKIYFTNEFIVERNGEAIKVLLEDIKDEDIIYDNIPDLNNVISDAKIVFLNGTCGKYEIDEYCVGTKKMFSDLENSGKDIYVGGGDTVSSVNKLGYQNKFKYLSSGGGATLEYVADGKLKALTYIEENGVEN